MDSRFSNVYDNVTTLHPVGLTLLVVALIASPLLLVAGSWNEITVGPAEADLAPPSSVSPAQDETDPVADDGEIPGAGTGEGP